MKGCNHELAADSGNCPTEHRPPTALPTDVVAAGRVGGVVLCGGKSTRMGLPKASLPFGNESMLARVVRILGTVAEPIVVVGAGEQTLPALSRPVIVARDRQPERGPLEGIRAGLTAIAPVADSAYVTSCDVPLLVPAFIRRLVGLLNDYEIVVPQDGSFHHPLTAVYRTSLVERIESLLEADRLRPVYLFELSRTRAVLVDELRDVDEGLMSLRNVNHPEEYFAALAAAGLEPAADVVAQLSQR